MSGDRCCVIYTKPARPGRVKTRLIGAITASEAAALQQALFDDLLSRLRGSTFELQVAWALEGDEAVPSAEVDSFRQQGRDLGARLYHGLCRAGQSFARVAAIGSDHPDVPVARVEEAFDRLDRSEIVIGPATDGGYYLIAARACRLRAELFSGIDWSSDRVLTQTLKRCRGLGLEVSLLPESADVDSPADLERLRSQLSGRSHDCPRTEELIRSWGMLP